MQLARFLPQAIFLSAQDRAALPQGSLHEKLEARIDL